MGDWESKDRIAGGERKSKLDLEQDGEGDATLHLSGTNEQGQPVVFSVKYEVQWEEKGDEIEIEMECRGEICQAWALDFTMECEEKDGGTELECDADGQFASLELDWELEED